MNSNQTIRTLSSAAVLAVTGCLLAGALAAQTVQAVPATAGATGTVPVYKVVVVGRTITAVNYHVLNGKTSMNLRGTPLLPLAEGKVTVEVKDGATHVDAHFDKVSPAQRFGSEYLTYVLWAITPEGRATNLGEVQLRGQSATVEAATPLQDFALLVTAEPYFAVSQPSDVVVMENEVKDSTMGAQAEVTARYDLLQRGQYRLLVNPQDVTEIAQDPAVPLDLYEAENALRIARWVGAEQYAPDVYRKAAGETAAAQADQLGRAGKNAVATAARAAVQSAEDARLLTVNRRLDAEMANAKSSAVAATAAAAAARADADASARQAADADATRQQAQADSALALQRQQAAEADAAGAVRAQAAAEASTAAAEQATTAAQSAQAQAESQARDTRARLLAQLNSVLQTRDTASGLIMNMSDVLFETGQFALTPDFQVKLAKISGILIAYPDLKLQINGYTDNVGGAGLNQKLSEDRANAVRSFLSTQGVNADATQATGFGMNNPVASNDNAAGRQQNRRVEMVVSGGVIGAGPSDNPR